LWHFAAYKEVDMLRFLSRSVMFTLMLFASCVLFLVTPLTTFAKSMQSADGDNSQWISNSPYSTVVAGQQFTVQFTFQNDGTSTWSDAEGYGLTCDTYYHPLATSYNGVAPVYSCMGGTINPLNGEIIAPGNAITFTVTLTAPTDLVESLGGSLGVLYQSWWDMEHNGVIFGNNNVYVSVNVISPANLNQGPTDDIGSVQIPQAQTPLYDAYGNQLPVRICSDGSQGPSDGNGNADLPANWDAVELAGLPLTPTSPSMYNFSVQGYWQNNQYYALVAYPDPCDPGQDYSDNSSIANGSGAVGYVSIADLQPAMSVVPTETQNPSWCDAWPPNCQNNTFYSRTTQNNPDYGDVLNPPDGVQLTAWIDSSGTSVDPHWWEVNDTAGNAAAVYGRDWVALPCSFPDSVQGCNNQNN
jgi:hypothetical protein